VGSCRTSTEALHPRQAADRQSGAKLSLQSHNHAPSIGSLSRLAGQLDGKIATGRKPDRPTSRSAHPSLAVISERATKLSRSDRRYLEEDDITRYEDVYARV
jgi:hypothetical protein